MAGEHYEPENAPGLSTATDRIGMPMAIAVGQLGKAANLYSVLGCDGDPWVFREGGSDCNPSRSRTQKRQRSRSLSRGVPGPSL